MACNAVTLTEDQLSCSLCLDLLRVPVTLPCGHTYCHSCIQLFWDSPRLKNGCGCPQCRATFDPRPPLSRNIVLEEVLQKLQEAASTRKEAAPPKLQSLLRDRELKQCVRHTRHQNKVKEKSLHELKESEKELGFYIRFIKHATDAALEESHRVFSKLMRCLEKQSREVKEKIREEEKHVLSRAENHLKKIQSEIQTLQRTSESEEQKFEELQFSTKKEKIDEKENMDELLYVMYESLRAALSDVKESLKLEDQRISHKVSSLKEYDMNTSEKIKATDRDRLDMEPRTRADFLHYYNNITLDLHTANCYVSLSEDLKEATTLSEPQSYSDRPERFTNWAQVLGRAGLAGRCYWEVEWFGSVCVGVCYRSMRRTGGGGDSKLGHNRRSWSLDCSDSSCSFHHHKLSVSVSSCSSKLGLYLDFRAGTLSFYDVCSSMKLLHKVQTSFTQPLYPAFWVGLGSTLQLCSLSM
ncbi:E3 ubiquitin/ISG15 ligase TRIM25-like isoform X1 [Gouania willdenowi]|uniref:E3 ubiquitin/ISG15 ligase TRIM25-like isoform X1 n=1 Tax=Gouania willdenowi TaxID=441366 RepID=UPI0010557D37|nr:E3 ubiquitin/ISG15 ligase TRIM25-like isoform X1 [Gouania willdenowi]